MTPLFWPSYDGKAIQDKMKILFPEDMSNRWLGQGEEVDKFEQEFAKKFGYKNALAVNSGSSALELAYHLLDLKPGDEVITPVLTCTATNLPLLRRGVKIVFADVKDDLTIDPDSIEITPKTKAIIGVTLGGLRLDPRIYEFGVPVVVDAAQSLGVQDKGDYICYSFQAIKHFTTGDGGMLICPDHERAKKLRWFGIDREAKKRNDWQPYKNREMTMDIEEPGYKFHMNDISAAIGRINLQRSDEYLNKRKELAEYYRDNLKCKTISGGAYWLFGIVVNNRDEVAEHLKENGIETNLAHLRNDIFTAFGGKRQNLPNMNRMEEKYLYIPFNLVVDNKEWIVKKINEVC